MSRRTYDDWTQFVYALEAVLKKYGLAIPPKSACEKAALALVEMTEVHSGRSKHDPKVDHREIWSRALSFGDLAEKVVLVRDTPGFERLIPHLRLIASAADLSQFSFTSRENQDNNKAFELYVATMALQVLSDCQFDNPENSEGDNPDIMGTYDGQRWAIACKAMHTTNPKTFADRVAEGVEQIQNCAADRGFVIVNMKNTVDHTLLWPALQEIGTRDFIYLAFPSMDHARARIIREFNLFHTSLVQHFEGEPNFYRHIFPGKKASPHVLLVYSTVTGYNEAQGPVFTMLRTMHGLFGPKDEQTEGLIDRLNNALHNAAEKPPVRAIEIK
jgi:hypothetical protein